VGRLGERDVDPAFFFARPVKLAVNYDASPAVSAFADTFLVVQNE